MKSKISTIEINQTLHGYSRGHTLLASSLNLSPKDDRRMLRLSDMSGPSMTKGFETYLTSYPLVDRSAYVIARTWYASEISRPGCVWTHSLIIDSSYLKMIGQPQSLLHLFTRPEGSWSSKQYKETIIINGTDNNDFDEDYYFANDNIFKDILFSIYSDPTKQVFVSTEKVSNLENFFLKIWEFQWPNLKKSFTFCTGAIENRSSSELLFNLQLIPERNRNSIQRKNIDDIFIPERPLALKNYPNWVSFLANQLLKHNNDSRFKDYLYIAGDDFFDGRSAYSDIVDIYCQINASDREENKHVVNDLLNIVARTFPNPDEALQLKSLLFGGQKELTRIGLYGWEETNILQALCTTQSYEALDFKNLRIAERAQGLLQRDSDVALKLLANILVSKPNRLGEEYIRAIFEKLNLQMAFSLANYSKQSLQLLLYNYPSIALETNLWAVDPEKREEALDILFSSPKLTKQNVVEIIRLSVENRVDQVIRRAFRTYPDLSVVTVLNWVRERSSNTEISAAAEWKYQLAFQPNYVMQWLSKTEWDVDTAKAFCSFVSLLDPSVKEILDRDIGFWEKRIKAEGLNDAEKVKLFAFLFAVAIRSEDSDAASLLAETFLTVHNAARDGLLTYESWRQSSDRLPELSWYQGWDKCERLRRGLLEKFYYKDWNPIYFFQGTDQADVFEKIIQYASDHKRLRSFISGMLDTIPSSKDYLSEKQRQILDDYRFI